MSEYTITRIAPFAWRVVKFQESSASKLQRGDEAVHSYEVRREPAGNYTCDCPRWMRKSTKYCRHTTMIQADAQVNPDRPLNEPFNLNWEE